MKKRSLLAHQEAASAFLIGRRSALLADEMGLGKSASALSAIGELMARQKAKLALVICPAYLVDNWRDEVVQCLPQEICHVIRGGRAERERTWRILNRGIVVVGYEAILRDIDIVAMQYWDVTVLDEVQRVKNPRSKMHIELSNIRSFCRWGLTGTPVENTFDDLFNIFSILDPEFSPMAALRDPPVALSKIRDLILRRTISEVTELPPIVHNKVLLELNAAQEVSYAAATRNSEVASELPRGASPLDVAQIGRLLRICSIDPLTKTSSKLSYLEAVLPNLLANHKVIVFSAYPNRTLKPLDAALASHKPILISGSLSFAERFDLVRRFQEDSNTRLALISVKAGGTGINLTAASYVFHFDAWWTASAKEQADSRAHRIGQEKSVVSTVLVTAGTIEERLWRLIGDKGRQALALFDELKQAAISEGAHSEYHEEGTLE